MIDNDESISKIGFNIGWDYHTFSLSLPEKASADLAILQGFKEAQKRASTKKSDRFQRKQLLLRTNAYLRGKHFDERITPEYLRLIDAEYCPVTKVKLTHGSMEDSDWSVDRIHNEAGYSVGNLIVVSTRANKAKANLTYEDICKMVLRFRLDPVFENNTGLNLFEWIRWQSITSKGIPVQLVKNEKSKTKLEGIKEKLSLDEGVDVSELNFVYTIAPCVLIPPPGIMCPPSDLVQIMIANACIKTNKTISGALSEFLKRIPVNVKVEFEKIIKSANRVFERQVSDEPLDIWFNEALYEKFVAIASNDEYWDKVEDVIQSLRGKYFKSDPKENMTVDVHEWHVETKGYLREKNK